MTYFLSASDLETLIINLVRRVRRHNSEQIVAFDLPFIHRNVGQRKIKLLPPILIRTEIILHMTYRQFNDIFVY